MPTSYAIIGNADDSDPKDFFRFAGQYLLAEYGYTDLTSDLTNGVSNIEDFLDAVIEEENYNLVRQVDRLAILSHSNEKIVIIGLGRDAKYPTYYFTFEDLITALTEDLFRDKLLSMIANSDGTRPTDIPLPEVHLFGCELGSSMPMMVLLRALLNPSQLVAPMYKHYVLPYMQGTRLRGVFELMAYKITLYSPSEFRNQSDLLDSLEAIGYKDINGQNVTREQYANYVPRNIGRHERHKKIYVHFGSNNSGLPTRWLTPYRLLVYRFLIDQPFPDVEIDTSGLAPGGELQAVKAKIRSEEKYQDNYPVNRWPSLRIGGNPYPPELYFPVHRQYGFQNFDDYFNSYNWELVTRNGSKAIYRGTTYRYEVYGPIVWEKDSSGSYHLVYNFVTNEGSVENTIRLLRTNRKLFRALQ